MKYTDQSIYIFLALFVFALSGCGESNTQTASEEEISPAQVHKLLNSDTNIVLIDVRTEREFTGKLGHIPGAVLKPVQQIDKWVGEFDDNRKAPIVMVCRSGNRSGYAAEYFSKNGFMNVYNMQGGMIAWNRSDFPVSKKSEE